MKWVTFPTRRVYIVAFIILWIFAAAKSIILGSVFLRLDRESGLLSLDFESE